MTADRRIKALLINPDPDPLYPANEVDWGPPMAILAIASYLEAKGCQVHVIDSRLYPRKEVLERIRDVLPGCVMAGFSVMTAQIPETLETAEYIRSLNPNVKIVVGGVHPSLFPRETAQHSLIDFVVKNEGEQVALDLVQALYWGASVETIHGLVYKRNGEVFETPNRDNLDMNNLPPQAYHLLDVDRYIDSQYPFYGSVRELSLQTSRGCPHQCTFCIDVVIPGYNKWRTKHPDTVLDEVRELVERYKINSLNIRDENFFVRLDHAKEVMEGLLPLRLRWFANIRANYFKPSIVSHEVVRLMKESGASLMGLGVESGSNRVLKFIRKGHRVEDTIRAAEYLEVADIPGSYSFMVGLPTETEEEMKQTVAVMKRVKRIHRKAMFVGPQILRPYPGGDLYDQCVKRGLEIPESLDEWTELEYGKYGEARLDYPWIEDKDLVEAISVYVPAALNWEVMKSLGWKRRAYSLLSRARVKTGFFRFPYEYSTYKKTTAFAAKVRKKIAVATSLIKPHERRSYKEKF